VRAGLTLVTSPTAEPLQLEQAKKFLRVDQPDDDDLIEEFIAAARDYFEAEAGVCFLPQTWDHIYDNFPYYSQPFELLRWPISSVVSLKFLDANGVWNTWDPTNYILNGASRPPRLAPTYARYWPILALQSLGNVAIRVVAGFPDSKSIPPRLKQGLYMVLGHWYEHREAVTIERGVAIHVPLGTEEIIGQFRPPMFA
jgi:uncharacterized phiE125 gp8 family phage protein